MKRASLLQMLSLAAVLAAVALGVNAAVKRMQAERYTSSVESQRAPWTPTAQAPSPSPTPAADVPIIPTRPEIAPRSVVDQTVDFQALYLNSPLGRVEGQKRFAIVAVSEQGKLNRSLAAAVADRLKSDSIAVEPSAFKAEFVTDGMFDRLFDGSTDAISKLRLAERFDGVVLAKEQVEYSTDPSLENLITATMSVEIAVQPTGVGDHRVWTFNATGAGFKQVESRALAEERLFKKLSSSTNLTLQ